MKPLGAAAEAAAKRIRHQKFYWCRLDNEFVDMALWRMVADRLRMPAYQVQAFVVRLESFGNAAIPRGYVGDFKPGEFAIALGMSSEDAARIYAELEHDDISWIVQEHIATFYERNPDKIDNTATERKQRQRAKEKGLRDLAKAYRLGQINDDERARGEAYLLGLSTGHGGHAVTDRDIVTVTPQHSRGLKPPPVDNFGESARSSTAGSPEGEGGEAGDNPQAKTWLRQTGVRIVVERLQKPRPAAETLVERWTRELDGDAAAIERIIRAAETADYRGASFLVLVTDQIKRARLEAEGRRLPLGPVGVRKQTG